jgi:hypothetical protein
MGKDNVFMERWHPMISSAGIKGYMHEPATREGARGDVGVII